jgi:hypothetical protein
VREKKNKKKGKMLDDGFGRVIKMEEENSDECQN